MSGLSANPALAAIQKAKTMQRQKEGSTGGGSNRGSMDIPVGSPGAARSGSFTGMVGSPVGSLGGARKSIDNPGLSHLGTSQRKSVELAAAGRNVFGVDDGNDAKGWWAHTDAHDLNADVDAERKKEGGKAYVPNYSAITPKQGLDFGSMLADRHAEAPAGADSAAAAAPAAAAAATVAPAAEPGAGSSAGGAAPKAGSKEDDEKRGWWAKMDAGVLNQAEEAVAKDQKQSFVPLMAGNLTKQLDFSKKEGAGAAAVAEGAEEGKKDASWSDFKSAA